MPSLIDDLAASPENARREPRRHPDGWEPGVEWLGTAGRVIAATEQQAPDWTSLLTMWGLDPAEYEIDGDTVQWRSWDAAIGNGEVRRMFYHRASVRRRRANAPDVADLVSEIKRHRPRRLPEASPVEGVYVLALNDWQIGKEGTASTVERILAGIDASVARVKELRRIGRRIDAIMLPGVGDLPEAVLGHYPGQTYTAELNGREQARVCRQLVKHAIDRHLDLAPRILVPAIAGNHGEKRTSDGKVTTTTGDNVDLEIFEGVAEAMATNPAVYGHVTFMLPRDDLTLTVQPISGGPIIGLAHGHSAPSKRDARSALVSWWKDQAFGNQPVGDADIMLVGHFHQYLTHRDGGRTLMIAPTVDAGSPWFAERWGVDSDPGMLSFLLTQRGWQDAQVL